jgi:hypothetical protein
MIPERPVRSFDEKAALAELERLRESIQAARKARQRTSEEFEAFVKGFRRPASPPPSKQPVATPGASEVRQQAGSESISRPLQSAESSSSAVAATANADAFDEQSVRPVANVGWRSGRSIRWLGVAGVIAVIALGLLSTRWQRRIPPPAPANAVPDGSVARPTAGTAAPAALPSAPPEAAARNVVLDLKVVRPVWMRVVVDGRTDVEGMVQSGEPLHFTGDQSIVVRVGNGGDVLVKTGDREESFGEAGQPLTRRFSKP